MWDLQVRAPIRLAVGGKGRDFIVASAARTADDLRDAIDAQLAAVE